MDLCQSVVNSFYDCGSRIFLGPQSFYLLTPLSGYYGLIPKWALAFTFFCRRRVLLSVEGLVARGGSCCTWRALLSRIFPSYRTVLNIFTLQVADYPPTFTSSPQKLLLFLSREGIYVSGGCFCARRATLARILPGYVSTPDFSTLQGLRT